MATRERAATLASALLLAAACSLTASLDDLKGGGIADGAPGAGGQAVVGGGGAWPDAPADTSAGGSGGASVGGASSGGTSSGGAPGGGAPGGGAPGGGAPGGGAPGGGASSGGTSSGGSTGCASGTADCDGAPGCETSILTDESNCGGCGMTCSAGPNSAAVCSGGSCDLSCTAGYANCNGGSGDGCEANLSSPANCGSCGTVCPSGVCLGGSCCSKPCGGSCCSGLQKCCSDALICVCSGCSCPI